MILRLALIFALMLTLPGCALTSVALGTAVGIGLAGGLGKFAGEQGFSRARAEILIHRKCGHLKTQVYRARCVNRLRYALHQYRF
jgi:hypothetical protein